MIFISAPYSHKDKNIEAKRYELICRYAAFLFANNKTSISPVMMGYPCLEFKKMPGDFQFWKDYSFELLSKCDTLHVLELAGWNESIGVAQEIIYADNNEIPVKYIEYNNIAGHDKYQEH